MSDSGDQVERIAIPKPEIPAEVEELTHLVIGVAIEVHRVLGPGFLESVYERAMAIELTRRGIPFVLQSPMQILYKGEPVGDSRVDMLVGGILIVEFKAVEKLLPIHTAQVVSYLKSRGHRLGLLFNFNVTVLKEGGIKRVIL